MPCGLTGVLRREYPSQMHHLTCRYLPAYHGVTHEHDGMDADKVFKALGDPTRRKLLDLLCERNGQTLGELCEHLDMARQSATQHIGMLEAANLVSTVWRGREKLHFINPVPLHEVYERWVRKFERQRLSLLHDLKRELEGE
jgi:DNA-binding transcriptional ArsR family regulator